MTNTTKSDEQLVRSRRHINRIIFEMLILTEEERKDVLGCFCEGCGTYLFDENNKPIICHCQNDE